MTKDFELVGIKAILKDHSYKFEICRFPLAKNVFPLSKHKVFVNARKYLYESFRKN